MEVKQCVTYIFTLPQEVKWLSKAKRMSASSAHADPSQGRGVPILPVQSVIQSVLEGEGVGKALLIGVGLGILFTIFAIMMW